MRCPMCEGVDFEAFEVIQNDTTDQLRRYQTECTECEATLILAVEVLRAER